MRSFTVSWPTLSTSHVSSITSGRTHQWTYEHFSMSRKVGQVGPYCFVALANYMRFWL